MKDLSTIRFAIWFVQKLAFNFPLKAICVDIF